MIPPSELDLIKIGEITKTHGYKGELVIQLSEDFGKLNKTEPLFLLIEGNLVPFFFEYPPKKYKSSGIIVKFENIDSDTRAEELLSCPVFALKENIPVDEDDENVTLNGYEVYNETEFIGIAGDLLNIPSNPLLTVITVDNKEVIIPLNEEFIISTDAEKRRITFSLPEGLLDINE